MVTENKTSGNTSDTASISSLRWSLRFLLKFVLPVVCVVAAVLITIILIKTGPKAQRQKPPQQARLVTVETAEQVDHQTFVSAMGTVIPAKQITLSPEVSGRVIFVSPQVIPGGTLQEGQTLIRIDSRNYEAVVKQYQSQVASAELNLKLEQGNQKVARQEYKMLDDIVQDQDRELVLRKPHLEEAKAALEAAKAALAKAQLDVERCTITAPFNAVIQDKFVDVGAQVSTTSSLLSVTGTDEFWIKAIVSVDQLKWLAIPENNKTAGSNVKIYDRPVWGPDVYRQGTVLRLMGQLEQQGRRAQLLVSVNDPLCLNDASKDKQKLLIDSYVSAEIEGQTLHSVIPAKRDYLHDGNYVWVMNAENKLEIRAVKTVFRNIDFVYITDGIEAGERIVTSDISAPVNGMLLRLDDDSAASPSPMQEDRP